MAITKVTNSLVATNAIQGTLIADNAITSVHIAQNQVTSVQIPDSSITAYQLAGSSVGTGQLVNLGVTEAKIANNAVTSNKIATNSVVTETIAQNSITAVQIPDGSITDTQLGSGAFTMGTITTTGAIRGPASLTIDPATVGDNTGTVVIAGNLQVDGTTTTINSTQLSVADKKITVGKGSGSSSAANESGFEVGVGADGASSNPSMLYSSSGTKFVINKPLDVTGNVTATRAVLTDGLTDTGQAGSATVFNESGSTADFRVESTGSTHMLFVDGGNNRVGIGTSSPSHELEIHSASPTVEWSDSDNNYRSQITQSGSAFYIDSDAGADGSSSMRFRINGGNEAMRISSSGNVGIGTSAPTQKLDVNGNIAVGYNTTDNNQILKTYATAHASGNRGGQLEFGINDGAFSGIKVINSAATNSSYNKQEIAFHTHEGAVSVAERMRITSTGNVGIGTSAPTAKLQVEYNGGHTSGNVAIANSSLDLYNPLEANTDEKGSILTFSDNYFGGSSYPRTTRAAIKGGTDTVGNTADGFLAFYTDASGANSMPERMRIDHDGKVGIGISAPTSALHLYTNAGDAYFKQTNTANAQTLEIGNAYSLYTGGNGGHSAIASNSTLAFATADTERMRINSAGNIGIGTAAPGHLLDILKSGSGDATVNIKSTTGGDPTLIFNSAAANRQNIIKFQDNGTNVGRIDYVHNGDRIDIQAGSATGATMSIKNGKVGIGVTGPNQPLEVDGNIGFSKGTNANRYLLVEGADATWAGVVNIQAGFGSTAAGGAVKLYGHSHGTYPGSVWIGGSANAAGSILFGKGGTGPGLIQMELNSGGGLVLHGPSANWNETTQGGTPGCIHLDPNTASDNFGNAITWGASDTSNGSNAHAGIYVRSDGSYGTKMYISTTDSYGSGSKTSIKIDELGRVTMPRQPAFKATRATGNNWTVAVSAGVYTQPFNVDAYDIGGNYNTSTYKFTAPVAGVYMFTHQCNAYGLDTSEYVIVSILAGGITYHVGQVSGDTPAGSGDQYATGSVQVVLAAGNTAEAQVNVVGGSGSAAFSSHTQGIYNSFSGYLIG